jgi:uncharacterized membrane protein YeaQ/YmgE (transglycosylase-associated protein family)
LTGVSRPTILLAVGQTKEICVALPLWLHWVLLGLLAGALAKYLMPGRDPSGCIVTIILGIVGAFIGGLIGTAMGWGSVTAGRFEPRSLALATLGAIVILLVGRLLRRL